MGISRFILDKQNLQKESMKDNFNDREVNSAKGNNIFLNICAQYLSTTYIKQILTELKHRVGYEWDIFPYSLPVA